MRQTAKMVLGYNICWLSSAVSCALSQVIPTHGQVFNPQKHQQGGKNLSR